MDVEDTQQRVDAFIAEDAQAPVADDLMPEQVEFPNLADDDELVKRVLAHIQYVYDKYKTDRSELEDTWEALDYMVKCGQNETVREIERGRTDRNSSDNATKTRAKRVGSTLFLRQVRTMAALLVDIVKSRRDPCMFRSRSNPAVPYSGHQADDRAEQQNAIFRYTREVDNFDIKLIEFAWSLMATGNVPVCVHWKRNRANVLMRQQVPGGGTRVTRKIVETAAYPSLDWIDNQMFYADQNIPDMQKQLSFGVKSQATWSEARKLQQAGEYINVETITPANLYIGGDENMKDKKEDNAGAASNTSDTNTGTLLQFDWYAELPIDDSKPKGQRWNPEKHPTERYWCTVLTSLNPNDGVCVRLQRNPDPDDDWPIEMISVLPFDKHKLYKMSLGEATRGNYNESTTTKQQMLDRRTLNNNRPMVMKNGGVRTKDGGDDYTWKPDQIFWADDPEKDVKIPAADPTQDNMDLLKYLDADTDEAIGTNRITRGEPMGGRTSSNEAEKAFASASRPHFMVMKYILSKFLRFYARKCIRFWNVYAPDDLVLKIADSAKEIPVQPSAMSGEFDIELNLVDEYENNIMQAQKFSFAVQSILPVFANVFDLREMAKDACDKVLQWDVTRYIKPDRAEESEVYARRMMAAMREGIYLAPKQSLDLDVLERELRGQRIQYMGLEDETPWIVMLDRALEEVKFLKEAQPRMMPGGTPASSPANLTEGQVAGNQIAGQLGAQQGGVMAQ